MKEEGLGKAKIPNDADFLYYPLIELLTKLISISF